MKVYNIKLLMLSIILCLGAGGLGSVFTTPAIGTWYTTLNKPVFSPPNFIFAPVWITLYILMAIAFYLVLINKSKDKKMAITFFLTQLILNVFWSIIFFGLHNPIFAFVEIIILWIAIFLTIKSFYKISRNASYLLIPYLLWVSFASVLNLSIVLLNP